MAGGIIVRIEVYLRYGFGHLVMQLTQEAFAKLSRSLPTMRRVSLEGTFLLGETAVNIEAEEREKGKECLKALHFQDERYVNFTQYQTL